MLVSPDPYVRRSNSNVVWHAALGGLLGLAVLIVVAVAMTWETSRGVLAAIIGASPPTVDYDGNVVGTSSTVIGLIGGSVGEHLAARRRLAVSAPVATPATALSEQELAKVDL